MGCGTSTNTLPATNQPQKPKANEVSKEPWQQLHSAVRWNKVDEVKSILDSSDSASLRDEKNGNYPIHIAAQNGHVELMKMLIAKQASVNSTNLKGNTPLHMAIGYDYYDAARLLVENGADENMTNSSGFPANRGLEGDKSFGFAALVSAEKVNDPTRAAEALDLCSNSITLLEKAAFASAGLKAKKALGEKWTPELQDKFKQIMMQL